ncbi:flagellin [Lachnospiraceae bacterium]|nr:flagellin [Lachnospiraceae bacterium]
MNSISSIGNYSYNNYINVSAISINEKAQSQVNGLNAGSENIASGQSLLNISDGALGQIGDYLQSIRELAIKASNGTNSYNDRRAIQDQIDQYKQGISDIASNTKYNETYLLDGSRENINIAADSTGSYVSVSGSNATLSALGIEDFDVTDPDFDITSIDDAISKVNNSRSTGGAKSNSLSHADAYNQLASYNTASSSMMKDELQELIDKYHENNKNRLLDRMRMMMQKKDEEQMKRSTMNLTA